MICHAVLTAVGTDRPGLVEDVSRLILEAGGNIEDSRMVNLHGQFAMMLLVGGAEPTLAALRGLLPELARQTQLQVDLHPADLPRTKRPAVPYHLSASAMDQAGLVHHIANVLKEMDINIEDLATRLTNAPITGTPLFEMELTMSVPAELHVSRLRQKLAEVCDGLNIDWQLRAGETRASR